MGELLRSWFLKQTDNCNVNLWPVGDRVFAFTETCLFREVDPETLDSATKHNFTDFVTINQVKVSNLQWMARNIQFETFNKATAHPMTDKDGHVYNMGSQFGKATFYNIFKMPVGQKGNPTFDQMEIVAKIPVSVGKYFIMIQKSNFSLNSFESHRAKSTCLLSLFFNDWKSLAISWNAVSIQSVQNAFPQQVNHRAGRHPTLQGWSLLDVSSR